MNAKPRKFESRLTVSLTGRDYDALNALADKDDVSASWLVRRAVEEYLRQRQSDAGLPHVARTAGEGNPAGRQHVRHAHRRETGC
ncbi:ribbon-helix-helix protein, CopG family [Acidiphilium sp.]|uniref:ribbon-helix-helix protein, CopG family n=1 Tax=Acidiphilium sp. TaxID=527 RepID=UPI00338E86A8